MTEHNRIIAEISLPKESPEDQTTEVVLDKLASEGKLLRATRSRSVATSSQNPTEVDWISVYRENRDGR